MHEYKQIYGFYWLVADNLMRLSKGKELLVKIKSQEFRSAHMEVKNFLFSTVDNSLLSRTKIFPIYTKELNLQKIERELSESEKLSEMKLK